MMNKTKCILLLCFYLFSLLTITADARFEEDTFGTSITVNHSADTPPSIDNVEPANQSYEQNTSLTVWVNMSDAEETFNWWVNCSDGSSDSGSNNATSNVTMNGLKYYTKYWINITCNDGNNETNEQYWFYTKNETQNYTYYNLSFGTSITVENPPTYNTTYIQEGFGTSIAVQGILIGDWNNWWVIRKGSYPEITEVNPINNSIAQPLSFIWNCTIKNQDGNTFDWSIECSNGQTNSSNSDINGSKNLTISGLNINTEYTVWVNTTSDLDSGLVNNSWYNFTTIEGLGVSNIYPENNSVNVLRSTAELNATIYQSDGIDFNWSIETTPNIGTNSSSIDSNGTKNVVISGNLTYQTNYVWYLNLSCEGQYKNHTYYFTTENLNNITNFNTTNYNSSAINLTWAKTNNVTTTYIRYKKNSMPIDITDGILLVNTTNTQVSAFGGYKGNFETEITIAGDSEEKRVIKHGVIIQLIVFLVIQIAVVMHIPILNIQVISKALTVIWKV